MKKDWKESKFIEDRASLDDVCSKDITILFKEDDDSIIADRENRIKAKMFFGSKISVDEIDEIPINVYDITEVEEGIPEGEHHYKAKKLKHGISWNKINRHFFTDMIEMDGVYVIILVGHMNNTIESMSYIARGYTEENGNYIPVTDWYIYDRAGREMYEVLCSRKFDDRYVTGYIAAKSEYALAKRIEEDYNRKGHKMAA